MVFEREQFTCIDRHTGLVCYEREFFYGGDGIDSCSPVSSIFD